MYSMRHSLISHASFSRTLRTLLCASACACLLGLPSLPAQSAEPIDLEWQRATPQQRLRVDQSVNAYRLLDSYPDQTFRGDRAFTRYELAEALARLQKLINQRYQVPVQVEPRMAAALQIYLQPTGDIPPRPWALQSILQNLSTGVLQAHDPGRLQFSGLNKVSAQELALSIYRFLDWLQVLPPEAQSLGSTPSDREILNVLTRELNLLPRERAQDPRQTLNRYDLAITLVNTLHYVEAIAKTRPLVAKVVIPALPAVPESGFRRDGRRLPAYYRLP